MNHVLQAATLIGLSFALISPHTAFSGVRIYLKNNRDIIADSCRESAGRLVCEAMGGAFEIEQKDILMIRQQTGSSGRFYMDSAEPPAPQDKEAESPDAPATDRAGNGNMAEEGLPVRGEDPEQEKRLDRITERKIQLQAEREMLSRQQEQLNQEVKSLGQKASEQQRNEAASRVAEIEERISRFNEEVKRLNAEEKGIIETLKKGRQAM